MSDTYTVERSATISAPAEQIYAHIIDFRRWAAWSPWDSMDPNMEKTYTGADSGVGARYAWSGNRKVGQGHMEITDAKENSEVRVALEFVKPFKATNESRFMLQPEGGGTRVTWEMTGKKTFLTRVMGLFKSMDAMVGPDFERGLASLKAVADR